VNTDTLADSLKRPPAPPALPVPDAVLPDGRAVFVAPAAVPVAPPVAPGRRHRLTASKITLARSCLWWARPDVELPEQDASGAAELGTALHAVAEAEADEDASDEPDEGAVDRAFRRVVMGAVEEQVLAELPGVERAALAPLAQAWREWWTGFAPTVGSHWTEQAFAVDPAARTARTLPSEVSRDYSAATAAEVPGTIDLIALRPGERVVVDYKTGSAAHGLDEHLDQLLFGATASALTTEWHGPIAVAVAHVTLDGVRWHERRVSGFELEVFRVELAALVEAIQTAEARPGLHCDEGYCPARAVCPATRALLLSAGLDVDSRRRLPIVGPIESNDQAVAVIVGTDLLEAFIANRRKAAKAYADASGGITAPDGRVYKGREALRETPRLDVAGAEDVLHEVLGERYREAITVAAPKTSFGAIRKVASARKGRGEKIVIKDVEEEARQKLRVAGALKVSKFTQYDWKKPGAGTKGDAES